MCNWKSFQSKIFAVRIRIANLLFQKPPRCQLRHIQSSSCYSIFAVTRTWQTGHSKSYSAVPICRSRSYLFNQLNLFLKPTFRDTFFLLLKKSDLAIIKISSHISSIDLEWQKLEPKKVLLSLSSSSSSSSSCDKIKMVQMKLMLLGNNDNQIKSSEKQEMKIDQKRWKSSGTKKWCLLWRRIKFVKSSLYKGGPVVSSLAFYPDDLSSNPAGY